MPEISVIVPVYKVEQWLGPCVDSILNQTFRDFELILVDDGSPDNSGALCEEYAKKDPRVRVLHKANGGLSSARNAGIEAAKAPYLALWTRTILCGPSIWPPCGRPSASMGRIWPSAGPRT